jgi:hypothetical protein
VKWLQAAWQLTRDVLMTGGGLALVFMQAFAVHPSGTLIGAGLVLLAPAGVQHSIAVYLSGQPGPGHGRSPSSPQSPSPSPSPSSPSGATGDGA